MLTCLLLEFLWPELAICFQILYLPAKPKKSDVPQVNFPDRNINKLRVALENTYAIVWVRSTRNSRWARSGQLLGFARAFSDRALTATIWDVAVGHPALPNPSFSGTERFPPHIWNVPADIHQVPVPPKFAGDTAVHCQTGHISSQCSSFWLLDTFSRLGVFKFRPRLVLGLASQYATPNLNEEETPVCLRARNKRQRTLTFLFAWLIAI